MKKILSALQQALEHSQTCDYSDSILDNTIQEGIKELTTVQDLLNKAYIQLGNSNDKEANEGGYQSTEHREVMDELALILNIEEKERL